MKVTSLKKLEEVFKMKKITVIGGGSSAHVLIPLLSNTGLKVNLLTRKPDKWSDTIELDYIKPSGEFVRSFEGKIDKISDKPSDVVPGADIIILCMPVHVYRLTLARIAPFIDKYKRVYIGTVYGQGGFNWMVNEIEEKFNLKETRAFAFGLIPWICRTDIYGHKGIVYGAKPVNVVATESEDDFRSLNPILFDKVVFEWFGIGKFKRATNFLSLTLALDNQIIHTSRMYGLFLESGGKWKSKDEVPYFYKDFSKVSARILKGLDGDYSKIRKKIKSIYKGKNFEFMLDYINLDNKTNLRDNKTYLDTFKNSSTLGAIETPVIEKDGYWIIDTQHRFFKDDIFYGLCIAKSIAEKLNIRTYHISKTLYWAQKMMGEKLIDNFKLTIHSDLKKHPLKYGVPEAYGILTLDSLFT